MKAALRDDKLELHGQIPNPAYPELLMDFTVAMSLEDGMTLGGRIVQLCQLARFAKAQRERAEVFGNEEKSHSKMEECEEAYDRERFRAASRAVIARHKDALEELAKREREEKRITETELTELAEREGRRGVIRAASEEVVDGHKELLEGKK